MKTLEENKYYIWLASITEINARTKAKLLQKYKEPQNLFYKSKNALTKEMENIQNIDEETKQNIINAITNEYYKSRLEKNIRKNKKCGISVLTYDDIEYPENLKNISDFPICMFYKGNIQILNNTPKIAIIGCRNYSQYGEKISTKFAFELAKYGIVIVSGCARGIDSFSHKGCLMAGKQTIAILGNGLDYIYPPENKILEEKIVENNGLLLSEYMVGTKPSKYTFPARNRIISGISDGILVVEAQEKSGTLITVDFALEQGRNVYAVPGNIDSKNATGTNELLKQGAKLVTNISDILEDFYTLANM